MSNLLGVSKNSFTFFKVDLVGFAEGRLAMIHSSFVRNMLLSNFALEAPFDLFWNVPSASNTPPSKARTTPTPRSFPEEQAT